MSPVFSMDGFGECNHGEVAYNQPGPCIDARYINGRLRVTVDCYTWLDDSGSALFDVDAWELQKLFIDSKPSANMRVAWYEAWRLARAFCSGRPISDGEMKPFTMREWVAQCDRPPSPPRGWEAKAALAHKRAFRVAATLPRRSIARLKKRIGMAIRSGEGLDPLMAWSARNLSRERLGSQLLRSKSPRRSRC